MITKNEFTAIELEVIESIKESFDFAYKHENLKNDFICLLADGNYFSLKNSIVNPYMIDYRLDKISDRNRMEFLIGFIKENYSFNQVAPKDSVKLITLELLIYTHIWESKPFLKLIKRLCGLCDSEEYYWDVLVPDSSKHKFILPIKDKFKSHNLKIGNIIENGFHSSLRNAFAHSEYTLEYPKGYLKLLNFKGESWEMDKIKIDQWTKRFCYSCLLCYHLYHIKSMIRKNIFELFQSYEFVIVHPQLTGKNKEHLIEYEPHYDRFTYK